ADHVAEFVIMGPDGTTRTIDATDPDIACADGEVVFDGF
ncbi:MAG: hypothetical protein ACI9WU_003294, partial [Myxococcota bacterium]